MPAHPSTQNVKVAVDTVIFTVRDGEFSVLLIQMKKKPFEGVWALPGGLIGDEETTGAAARRILREQTAVADVYLEQLATFDAADRDPNGRVVSVAYYALMPADRVRLRTNEKYADVRWWPVKKPPALAYDHANVLRTAAERLRSRLGYTNIAWGLLPDRFPLSRLREIYECILGRELDKRNFIKKISALGLVARTGRQEPRGAHRPAELYRFKDRRLKFVEIL